MHMFNRQKNIIHGMTSKLQNHPDDEIELLQPLQVELDNLHNLFMAYKPVFSSVRSILQTQPLFDWKTHTTIGTKETNLSILPWFSTQMVNRNSHY